MSALLEHKTQFDIQDAVSLLDFTQNHSEEYAQVICSFQECVLSNLARMKQLAGIDSPEVVDFELKASFLTRNQLSSYYLQPEVLNRILNFERFNYSVVNLFTSLNQFLDAEIARSNHKYNNIKYPYLWSASGDYFIKYDATQDTYREFHAVRLSTGVPLDFFSVNLLAIRKEDVGGTSGDEIVPYEFDAAEKITSSIQEAIDPLHAFPNGVFQLLSKFAGVILVKRILNNEYCISGTNGSYINRVVLANPELLSSSPLIDALVHECIHGFLFMVNEVDAWLPTIEEAEPYGEQFISYWSGRGLPLRSFLEAHFVWYGLLRFWEFALQHNMYSEKYALERIKLIKSGFAKVNIEAVDARLSKKLTKKLITAIHQMKSSLSINY
jgi:hypothetical protein